MADASAEVRGKGGGGRFLMTVIRRGEGLHMSDEDRVWTHSEERD